MQETHTAAEWEKRVRTALLRLKSAQLPRDTAEFDSALNRLRHTEEGKRVAARLGKKKSTDDDNLLFLLALQVDLLQQENRQLCERYVLRRSQKREAAWKTADPLERMRLLAEAEKEESAGNPVAHAADRVKWEREISRLIQSGGPKDWSDVRKRGQQDERLSAPLESAWGREKLEMDIYELAEGTHVRRSTLLGILHSRRAKEKVGRKYVYGPDTVRCVVKEWLTNPYWHKRSPASQRDYLKVYLHSTANYRPEQFISDLRLLACAVKAVSKFDPAFPKWLDDLRSAFPRVRVEGQNRSGSWLYRSLFRL